MKAKKIVTLVLITFLLSFSQEVFSQNWKVWFKENGVEFSLRYVQPVKKTDNPYYHLKVANMSGKYKTIYFYPVFMHDGKITGTATKRNFFLKPSATYKEKFYVTQQAIIQAGNHVPSMSLKEYSVKEY